MVATYHNWIFKMLQPRLNLGNNLIVLNSDTSDKGATKSLSSRLFMFFIDVISFSVIPIITSILPLKEYQINSPLMGLTPRS